MWRDGMKLDLHLYYPVLAYPPGVRTAELAPERHPGRWFQPFSDLTAKGIRYEDLLAHSVRGETPDTSDLVVPDPNMAVLLLCAHEFRSSVNPSLHADTQVRLGTLATIVDLARCREFSETGFQMLVDRFAAQDAVCFVASLVERYFGIRLLDIPNCTRELDGSFPRLITWFGAWARLGPADTPLDPADLSSAILRLGPNAVAVTRDGPNPVYTVGDAHSRRPDAGTAVSRLIVRGSRGRTIPFQFSLKVASSALALEITFTEPLTDDDHLYYVEIYGDPYPAASQGAHIRRRGAPEPFGQGSISGHSITEGHRLALEIPLAAFHRGTEETAVIPLMVVVGKWFVRHPYPHMDVDSLVVVPLEVSLGGTHT
jgi:hypothetical protein